MGAAAALRQALDLWGGDAYAEFADEDWARPEASDNSLTFGAINTLSSMVIPPKSSKTQSKVIKTFLRILVFFP